MRLTALFVAVLIALASCSSSEPFSPGTEAGTGDAAADGYAAPADSGTGQPDGLSERDQGAQTGSDSGQGADSRVVADSGPATDGATGSTYYISPSGSDSAPGTASKPFKTFKFALNKMQPGDTLVLEDGTYDASNSGTLDVSCKFILDGLAKSPIKVRAEHERKALIRSDGAQPAIHLQSCSYWTIEGLRAEGKDNSSAASGDKASVVRIYKSNNITLRRLLVRYSNRNVDSKLILIDSSSQVQAEECEMYDYHATALLAASSANVRLRRNYINARGRSDISGGLTTSCPATGDEGITLYQTKKSQVQNNIVENGCSGFVVRANRQATGDNDRPDNNTFKANVAVTMSRVGYLIESRCGGQNPCKTKDRIVENNKLTDCVAINCDTGLWMRGGAQIKYYHNTVIGGDVGVQLDLHPDNTYLASDALIDSTLVLAGQVGARAKSQSSCRFYRVTAHGHATVDLDISSCTATVGNKTSDPNAGIAAGSQVGLKKGQCAVYIPKGNTNLHGAGINGTDVGASVIEAIGSGGKKLWDATTGQFTCGAVVKGVNDSSFATSSCTTVHKRLNVGVNGCPVP